MAVTKLSNKKLSSQEVQIMIALEKDSWLSNGLEGKIAGLIPKMNQSVFRERIMEGIQQNPF